MRLHLCILPNRLDTLREPIGSEWSRVEDLPAHPFERALRVETTDGWKAADAGPQLICLRFDSQQTIKPIHLQFLEKEKDCSQEIALFATPNGSPREDLIRQQWVFSPRGATAEVEDYVSDLREVTTLGIDPGRHDKQVFASLRSIQIG